MVHRRSLSFAETLVLPELLFEGVWGSYPPGSSVLGFSAGKGAYVLLVVRTVIGTARVLPGRKSLVFSGLELITSADSRKMSQLRPPIHVRRGNNVR